MPLIMLPQAAITKISWKFGEFKLSGKYFFKFVAFQGNMKKYYLKIVKISIPNIFLTQR